MSVRSLSVLGAMFVCAVATAGDLNPPFGAVSPTMLPLDRIEPRVCVNDLVGAADAMHVITQPGVYFVGADIVAGPGQSAILIDIAPGIDGQVVLDLGAFTLHGAGGGGGASGIKVPPLAGPIYVLSPNSARIANFGGHGIEVLGVSQVSIDGVSIADCFGDGVHVVNSGEVLLSANVRACAGNGVTVMQSGAVRIVDTTVANTGADGVHVFQVAECVISSVGVAGAAGDGIDVMDADYMAINESALPGPTRKRIRERERASRVAGSGGNGVIVTDCGTIEIEDLLIDGAGGNGITLLAPQVASSAVIRRMHVRETVDGLYATDLEAVRIEDWLDEDCADEGIEIFAGIGQSLNSKFTHISTTVSRRAADTGIRVIDPSFFDSYSASLTDCVVDGGGVTSRGIDLQVSDATLENVTVRRASGIGANAVFGNTLTVTGFIAENNGAEGLFCWGLTTGSVSMRDFRISKNGVGGASAGDGAVFYETDTLVLRDGESTGNFGSGIRVTDLNRDGRLDLVTCSTNGGSGVSVESISGVALGRFVVSDSVFGSNGGDGIFLEATTGGQVVDCTATSNSGWGIRVLGSNHVIQRNACLGNFGGSLLAAAPGNIVGPMVNEFTVGANTNPAANYE